MIVQQVCGLTDHCRWRHGYQRVAQRVDYFGVIEVAGVHEHISFSYDSKHGAVSDDRQTEQTLF